MQFFWTSTTNFSRARFDFNRREVFYLRFNFRFWAPLFRFSQKINVAGGWYRGYWIRSLPSPFSLSPPPHLLNFFAILLPLSSRHHWGQWITRVNEWGIVARNLYFSPLQEGQKRIVWGKSCVLIVPPFPCRSTVSHSSCAFFKDDHRPLGNVELSRLGTFWLLTIPIHKVRVDGESNYLLQCIHWCTSCTTVPPSSLPIFIPMIIIVETFNWGMTEWIITIFQLQWVLSHLLNVVSSAFFEATVGLGKKELEGYMLLAMPTELTGYYKGWT